MEEHVRWTLWSYLFPVVYTIFNCQVPYRTGSGSVRGHTCVYDCGPGLDVDAGSRLPGPEYPHEGLCSEDAGSFAHLGITASRLVNLVQSQ